MPLPFGIRLSALSPGRRLRVLLCGVPAAVILGCAQGYTPHKVPEPDIDALLAAPQYASVQIIHEPDAGRSVTAAAFAGNIIIEYLVDDNLVGSHSAIKSFDEIINLLGGDHEVVIQQCYQGLMTLGGRSCQYIKYQFRIHAGERGRINIAANVLRPRTAGFVQWHEIEASQY